MFPIMFPILFSKCSLLLSHILTLPHVSLCCSPQFQMGLLHACLIFSPYALPNAPYIVHIFLKHPTYIAPKLIAPHLILYSFLKSLLFVVYIRCAKWRGYNAFYLGSVQQFETLFWGGGGQGFKLLENPKIKCIISSPNVLQTTKPI